MPDLTDQQLDQHVTDGDLQTPLDELIAAVADAPTVTKPVRLQADEYNGWMKATRQLAAEVERLRAVVAEIDQLLACGHLSVDDLIADINAALTEETRHA